VPIDKPIAEHLPSLPIFIQSVITQGFKFSAAQAKILARDHQNPGDGETTATCIKDAEMAQATRNLDFQSCEHKRMPDL
jgi:hypothetical protein